jgi:hypothetical protein
MIPKQGSSGGICRIDGKWRGDALLGFTILLQGGFLVPATVGLPVKRALEDFGISPAYIDEQISTVFLDGCSVDNLDKARVKELSVLALSSAMPGFVGAALRKGGFYGAMRKEITLRDENGPVTEAPNFMTIKLFNFIAADLGPGFLAKGIRVQADALLKFFQARTADFWEHCLELSLNNARISRDELLTGDWAVPCTPALLTINLE